MALIKCKECGKEVSSNAAACPNCRSPIPKRQVPVTIERKGTLMMAVDCCVIIDGHTVADLKPGKSATIQLPVGTHYVGVESSVRSMGYSAADTRAMAGTQFIINDDTKSVTIHIKTKASWTGGTGKCVVDSIDCN